jgi:hypothetical protein
MVMELHSINREQRLYVMPAGDGFSCYGFDVLDRKAIAVRRWLSAEGFKGDLPPVPTPVGTEEHFAACAEMMRLGAEFNAETRKQCPAELVSELIGLEGKRVEADVFEERARFWVGKSTGWMPCHLLIKTRRSSGGGALHADFTKNIRVIY